MIREIGKRNRIAEELAVYERQLRRKMLVDDRALLGEGEGFHTLESAQSSSHSRPRPQSKPLRRIDYA
jgi:hypothetical protein